MLTIVEIPHQRPAFAWTASDYGDALDRAAGDDFDHWAFADAREALPAALADNHAAFILETADDWRWFFRTYNGHQSLTAQTALRRLIRRQIGRGGLAS